MGIIKSTKRWGIIILTLSVLALATSLRTSRALATDSADQTNPSNSEITTASDPLHSVTLTYDQDVVDIYNNVYVVSIDDQKDITLDFDVEEGFYGVKTILLRDITEDGEAKNICHTGERQCSFNATKLIANSGLEIILYDWDDNVVRQTMLGLIIKQNATKEDYELPLSMGPSAEVNIDMSSVSDGMKFSVSPIPIPVKYEHYSDGRSVIGIGFNSTDTEFWNDAANNKMQERISKSDMYQKWEESKKHEKSGKSLGLVWSVGGYATSYSNNPDKMTGTIQFYVGSGYNLIGQYAIFTYSVTVTFGADGEFVFTLSPSDEPRLSGNLNLGVSAGLELYGGIGSGWLASIGIYGAAKVGANMHLLPEFDFYRLYVSGEVGLKAKVLGRTVLTFTFVSGSHEFINNKTEENGITTYATDLNLKDIIKEKRDQLIAEDYGDKPAGEIKTPVGETTWNLNNLDQPTRDTDTTMPLGRGGGPAEDNNLTGNNPNATSELTLSDAPLTQISHDYDYAHRVAENVYAESGVQIMNHPTNDMNAVAAFASNDGELNYSVYDGTTHTMSEPRPVAGDEGQDFGAHFSRGSGSDDSYLVWRRLTNDGSDGATLTEVAKSGEIMLARFDPASNEFVDQEQVSSDSSYIYGGVGVTTSQDSSDDYPYIFAYTNDDADPEGLIDGNRSVVLFRKNGNQWDRNVILNLWGTIASFDVGIYDGKPSAVVTLWNDYADKVDTYVVSADHEVLATFSNAWGAQFVTKNGEPTLVFMRDGKLYSSTNLEQKEVEFGDDENSLPNAPFKIIGDLDGTMMVSYLSNVDSRQNIVGYVKAGGTCSYEPVVITNVSENSNVTYYAGLFVGDEHIPFIIYTVQNYQYAEPEWVEGEADMYALSGTATNHISILAADITNLRDLAVNTNTAKVDVLLKNTGLFHIDKFSLYLKESGEYVKLGDYEIPALAPGELYSLELELPEADYDSPRLYTLGATSRDDEYAEIGVQSESQVAASAGEIQITDVKYDFHNRGNHDAYTVTAKSLGPGHKDGKLVFYNTIDKTVYKEVPITDLTPGREISAVIENTDDMLSSTYEHLAVRVAPKDSVDNGDNLPTPKLRHLELLPAWFKSYINKVGGRSAEGEEATGGPDIAVPDTGEFTRVAVVGATGVALPVLAFALPFLLRKRKN